jgi:hypothetical protein
MELAHIAMGHHIDTRYAFNDRLMFPDEATFQRINMYHTDHDNAEAAKRAMEYLGNSMYKDKLPSAGLYYAQLVDREKELKALNTPRLGDSLLREDGTPWMADLQKMAPKLNWDDLTQRAALPLGSWLKTDPWDDRVHQLNAKIYAYMNPRDKMPLEVTPIFFKLQRYDASRLTPPAGTSAPAAATAQPDAAQPETSQPDAAQPAAQPEPGTAPASSPESGTAASPSSAPADAQPATPDAAPQQSTGTSQPPTQ